MLKNLALVLISMAVLAFLVIWSRTERAKTDHVIQERQEQEAAQQAEFQEIREAETALMSDLSTAVPALEERIRDWITVEGDLLIIREPARIFIGKSVRDRSARPNWHVMPATVPWFVSCEGGTVEVTIGSWASGDRDNVNANFSASLVRVAARLPGDLCRTLAIRTAERLSLIMKGQ